MLVEMPDRRSQRTRSALHAAFVELLLEQGYNTLKIGAVAERANVGRSNLLAVRLRQRPAPPASIPIGVLARQIADAQLSLVESWVLGRTGFEQDVAARTLLRSSVALAALL